MPRIVRKRTIKNIAKKTFKFAYKQAVSEVDNRVKMMKSGVNSNYKQSDSTTNTGAQSLETVKKTGKKTVKTVKRTVKATKNTIRTVKNTPKRVKRTVKTAAKVVKTTVKVIKVTVKVVSKIIAFLGDPAVFVCVIALIIAIYLIVACVAALGGAAAGEANTKKAYSQAAGLGDVPKEFQQGLQVLKKCKDDRKKAYEQWIDTHLHYDENNKRESDLVYMKKYDKINNETEYQTGLASDSQKNILKNALTWDSAVDDEEILSIAYVLEQKTKNELTPEAEYKIHTVKYTEDLINQVLNKVVEWKDSHVQNGGVECPSCNCSVKEDDNPEKKRADDTHHKLLDAYNIWENDIRPLISTMNGLSSGMAKDDYDKQVLQPAINNWKGAYEHDSAYGFHSPYISNNGEDFSWELYNDYSGWWDYWSQLPDKVYTYYCAKEHTHYSEVLEFYNKDQIMTMLNFNEVDKYWEQLTEDYLRTGITPAGP